MANFPSFTFTTAGRAAITRSLSGKDVDRLIVTKCVLGDGVYSGGIETLNAVTSPKLTVTVSEHTDNGDGTSVTRFVYDNASLGVGFAHREMGIYAKNGDSGTELLLCYSNAGSQYSYIKAGTIDSVTKQRKATIPPQTFKFVLATGGSGSVDAVIDPKGYVDVEMLETKVTTALATHNTAPTAHPDKLVNLTTNGNSLRAVKGDGTNVDVVVQYAVGTTQANPKDLGGFTGKTLGELRDILLAELDDMQNIKTRYVKFGANIGQILAYWGTNWDVVFTAWGTISCVITKIHDNATRRYAKFELTGFSGETVILLVRNEIWELAEKEVRTIKGLNRADTWGLRGIDFTFDFMGSSTDQILFGGNTVNYLGNGFKYLFKDGKGSYADIYADEYYGTFRGKAMVGGITQTVDLNNPYTDTYSKKLEVTGSTTANNLPYKYNFITTLKSNTDIVQLAIPVSSKARISLRCLPNQNNNNLVGDWLEIPYLRDIQPIAAAEVAKIVNSAPSTLDTLNELANALGNDPNFATTVSTEIGKKADKTDVDNKIQDVNTKITTLQNGIVSSLATHNTDPSAHTAILNAIKAISGMDAYNTAPSMSLASIIPLLGSGGIVAQKLDDNGYVKFANGFTIQWGYDKYASDGESHWVTFPIAFAKCFSVIPCIIGGSSDSIKVNNINSTGFEKASYYNFQTGRLVSRPCIWIAVGVI